MVDAGIIALDKVIRTLFASPRTARVYPGIDVPEAPLSGQEREHAAALMRINHVGEVCAQALYQGQSIVSRDESIRRALEKACLEETEHLAWTERRISELAGRKSLLNPLWYAGAFAIGVVAARFGDSWNLGFLEETERQVGDHLINHLAILPTQDERSKAIVRQMVADEAAHADMALEMGGARLPSMVKVAMRVAAEVMRRAAYRI